METILFITEDQVKELLNWDDVFDAVKVAMECVSSKRVVQNARSISRFNNDDDLLLAMPGQLQHDKYGGVACKLVTQFPGNKYLEKPLPIVNANIAFLDDRTGILKAMVGGTNITTWRTAAASAVSVKYLCEARLKTLNTLAILGSGNQAETHAKCLQHLFKFKEFRIWNHNPENGKKLVDDLNKRFHNVFKFVEKNEECVRGADVIVTTTMASEPIVKLEWVKSGAHISAVGVNSKNHFDELDLAIYKNCDLYVDSFSSATVELAGLLAEGVHFKGELGGVISGQLSIPADPNRITVFQGLGMAVEDCAVARMIYDLHCQRKNM